MNFQILIEPPALREIDEAYLFIAAARSDAEAGRWFNRLEKAILSLERFPKRFPRAAESDAFQDEVRQLTCGVYRVLFVVRGSTVHVLHVRHTSRVFFDE